MTNKVLQLGGGGGLNNNNDCIYQLICPFAHNSMPTLGLISQHKTRTPTQILDMDSRVL